MTDANKPPQDLPLVTFALFAFNQEKYIREAVEGAFAQTYEPLEIILSDDCSSDRTFEIIEEMAAAYEGPHRVVLNRTDKNSGTIDHALAVARKAHGQLIVVAAGDDVSHVDRVVCNVERWIGSGASVIQSQYCEMNAVGELIVEGLGQRRSDTVQNWFRGCESLAGEDGIFPTIIGCAAAYERHSLDRIPFNHRKCLNEDAMMTILSILNGYRIETIDKDLVSHRRHVENVSSDQHARSLAEIRRNEMSKLRFARSTSHFIDFITEYLEEQIAQGNKPFWEIAARNIRKDRSYSEFYVSIWQMNFFQRMNALLRARDKKEVKLILPRLFGQTVFVFLKKLLSKNSWGRR